MFRCHSHSPHSVPSLQCQVCHRTYDRLDHLNRHLDSRTYFSDIDPLMRRMLQKGRQALTAQCRGLPKHVTPA
ncbi:C2H2 type zinc finger domain containing [Pyrenophora seminiperda CCB06]|uniref:C2H2 type zinc finger domain containing n=1 Tax=Pyrenophora seminiperda CCB06 TaxID=1302712 RepID=A0A3M7MBQ4_9PLEO|nr:C2H2 type zinc finger domain containing [Pyrenophora seminiperda CCB06]